MYGNISRDLTVSLSALTVLIPLFGSPVLELSFWLVLGSSCSLWTWTDPLLFLMTLTIHFESSSTHYFCLKNTSPRCHLVCSSLLSMPVLSWKSLSSYFMVTSYLSFYYLSQFQSYGESCMVLRRFYPPLRLAFLLKLFQRSIKFPHTSNVPWSGGSQTCEQTNSIMWHTLFIE